MVTDEIRVFLNDYFDVLQSQDMSLFDRVFHQDCVLFSTQDGQTVVRPYKAYRDMVQGRASPQSMHAPRQDNIVMLDVLSDEMALAKVQLRLFDNIMVDYLNLMKIRGSWMVVAKHFWRKGPAE
ncbi:MAG: hypothetical protein EBR42_00070 [Betaproteobacteria bacterium]|jgi:hypothetical protein|nr:hypothetical protein [Betaproteobacteria bacterium]